MSQRQEVITTNETRPRAKRPDADEDGHLIDCHGSIRKI